MSHQRYVAKYTSCGRSINDLKSQAKSRSKNFIPYIEALNEIARELKYSNWQELEKQPVHPTRDAFFQDVYSSCKKNVEPERLYREHLLHTNSVDSKEVCRKYALLHWKQYNDLGFANISITTPPLEPSVFRNKILALNPTELIPQKLSSEILETLIYIGRGVRGIAGQRPSDICDEYLQCVCKMVLVLFVLRMRMRADCSPIVEVTDLERSADELHCLAEIELVARRTKMKIIAPDIHTIFNENMYIGFKFPDGFKMNF